MTDAEGNLRWEGQSSAWGKLLRETTLQGPDYLQNIRMQGQYLDRDKFFGNKFEQRFDAGPVGVSLRMRRVFRPSLKSIPLLRP